MKNNSPLQRDFALSRTAHRLEERPTATHSAWGTPGLRNVVDMTTLAY